MLQRLRDRFSELPRRWQVLAAYAAVAGISQMLWLNFAPLIGFLQTRYGVSEFEASLPTLVFPLFYVLLSLPSGAMVDHKGFRFTVGLGAALMSAGAVVRIVDSYSAILAGQIIIAIGQPFVMNGISKLVADWFDEHETALATGLGTVGMFVGCALGMALSPPLASLWLPLAMVCFAALTVLAALAFWRIADENPEAGPHIATDTGRDEIRRLLQHRDLVKVFVLGGLGLGFFNGLTTWLEGILGQNGIGADAAGLVGGVFIVGGIIGSILVPALSDRLERRKPFVIGSLAITLTLLGYLCDAASAWSAAVAALLLGMAFLPAYALLLAMSEELAGKDMAGMATGILMMAGNAGGVVVILLMDMLHGTTWDWPVRLLHVLLVAALVLGVMLRETFHRNDA